MPSACLTPLKIRVLQKCCKLSPCVATCHRQASRHWVRLLLTCRHVMHAHLTHLSEPSTTLQGLTEQAAFFLLSICIRSAEGRKRIVSEIVQTLNPSDKGEQRAEEQAVVRRPASNPYKAQTGFPAPHKVSDSNSCLSPMTIHMSLHSTLKSSVKCATALQHPKVRLCSDGHVLALMC